MTESGGELRGRGLNVPLRRGTSDGSDKWSERTEPWQRPSCRVKSRGQDHEEGQQDDDLKMKKELPGLITLPSC